MGKLNSYRELYVSSKTNRDYLKNKIEEMESGIEGLQEEYKKLTRNTTDIAKEILCIRDEIMDTERSIKEKSTVEEVLESVSKLVVICQTSESGERKVTLMPKEHMFFENQELRMDENIYIDRGHIEEIISEMEKILSFI